MTRPPSAPYDAPPPAMPTAILPDAPPTPARYVPPARPYRTLDILAPGLPHLLATADGDDTDFGVCLVRVGDDPWALAPVAVTARTLTPAVGRDLSVRDVFVSVGGDVYLAARPPGGAYVLSVTPVPARVAAVPTPVSWHHVHCPYVREAT